MKKVLILLLILSFAYCASGDDIIIESQTNKAKADTTKEMYNSTIGGSQYINYQWSLIAKEKTNENIILRSVCLGLIAGSISYVGAGQLCALAVSGGVGYISYNWINK